MASVAALILLAALTARLGENMIVVFQRLLAPYGVSLFNSLSDALDGQFALVLTRPDPTPDRLWTVPWPEVRFRTEVLRGHRLDIGRGTWEVSRGVRATLDGLKPQAVVLGGWDVHACWAALRWARRRGVPVVGWVASSQQTGLRRGVISSTIRRRFLSACSAAIVPGAASEAFVRQLAPAILCHQVLNSVDSPDLRAIAEAPPHGAAVFIGELSQRKGVDLILAAAPNILQLFPRLIIAGDGPMRSDVTALAARLPGVEYVGFVEGAEKTQLFEQAAVVLVPSRRDCGPMVASEALVALRPIVAGPGVGAFPDLRRLAGDAVSAMRAATPVDLVDAARRAKGRAVSLETRAALRPEAAAASMAAAVRFAASARQPVARGLPLRSPQCFQHDPRRRAPRTRL
jgi:glycosyltransferase involved in cell wall biosynthesis